MLTYKYGADELCIYLDAKTSLPTQTDILDDDPLEGYTSYLLRYGDWRKVGCRHDAVQPALCPAPLVKEFVAGLDKLAIDVATIVGIHGDSAPMQATRGAWRKKVIQPMEKDGFIEVD